MSRYLELAKPYVRIARFDHWVKNIFVLPGIALALVLDAGVRIEWYVLPIGLVAVGLVASANYTINEYLDAEFDRLHPLKKDRPGARGQLTLYWVLLEYLLLAALGLGLATRVNVSFVVVAAALLIMGLIYNVQPLRTKDRVYLDVLSESVNNPLRFLLGWYMVVQGAFPPSSILLSYWMGGAFLMSMKRYAECRSIKDAALAGRYRRSFKFYTEDGLLLFSFFYALTASFLLGIFLIKYRIEFIITFPLFSILFVWYLRISSKDNSSAQRPEKLYMEKSFVAYVIFLSCVVALLFFVDIPMLYFLLDPISY